MTLPELAPAVAGGAAALGVLVRYSSGVRGFLRRNPELATQAVRTIIGGEVVLETKTTAPVADLPLSTGPNTAQTLDAGIAALRGTVSLLEDSMARQERRHNEALARQDGRLERLEERLQERDLRIEALEDALRRTRDELTNARGRVTSRDGLLREARDRIEALEAQVAQLEQALAAARSGR